MSPRSLIAVTAIVLGITLGLVSPASAAAKRARICCTTFNRKPINPQLIRGFMEIPGNQNCRLSAIIFYTKRKNEICADPEDEWVKRALAILSNRLKNMSKLNSDAVKTQAKKGQTPSATASSFSTTEAITNSTEEFYW